MKVKEMIDYLNKFDPGAPVLIWEWIEHKGGGFSSNLEPACNLEHQQDTGIPVFRISQVTTVPSDVAEQRAKQELEESKMVAETTKEL